MIVIPQGQAAHLAGQPCFGIMAHIGGVGYVHDFKLVVTGCGIKITAVQQRIVHIVKPGFRTHKGGFFASEIVF